MKSSSLLNSWYLAGFSEKRSIGVLPRARSDKTTKKPVKITQKAKRRTPDRSSNIDHLSEAEDAALPLNTPWNTTRSPMNLVPPLPSIYNWSWNTDAGHNAGNWTHPSCTFSGKGVIINQGVGNAIHSNFSNINNDRSANYYHYWCGRHSWLWYEMHLNTACSSEVWKVTRPKSLPLRSLSFFPGNVLFVFEIST